MRDRLSETAYRAISWVVENFARADAELEDETAETGTSQSSPKTP